MKDKAHKITDDLITQMEKDITKSYNQAIKEMKDKLATVISKVDTNKDPKQLYALLNKQKRIERLLKKLTDDLNNTNKIATDIMNNAFIDVYSNNYNYSALDITRLSGAKIDWNLYNRNTIKAILNKESNVFELMALDNLKDKSAIFKELKRQLVTSILQGESIPQIAKRISKVAEKKRSDAIRIARTETTRVENQARKDAMTYAEGAGLKIKKVWQSTLDSRTRHTHIDVNGEAVGINETFSNGMEFPGDPTGGPSEVCNCRCTMITEFVGLEKSKKEIELDEQLKNITEVEFFGK